MLDSMGLILEESFYEAYNSIIFYLKKIPLIGKLIPDKFYKVGNLKDIVIFLGIIKNIFASIIKKFIYVALVYFVLQSIFNIFELKVSEGYLLSFLMLLSLVGFYK